MKKPAIDVAHEALFQLACAQDYANWTTALMAAIQNDIEHGRGIHANTLASLGQYLADSWCSDMACAASELQGQLETAGGAQ